MVTKNFDQLIAAAVLWWTSHLSKLSVEGINGDNESHESFIALYARLTAQQNEQMVDENVKKFMQLLTEHLKEKSMNGRREILDVDYFPEWPLSDICEKAGVNGMHFPQKTTMYINFEKETATWSTVRGPQGQVVYPVVEKKKEEMA